VSLAVAVILYDAGARARRAQAQRRHASRREKADRGRERIGQQLADALGNILAPHGIAVYLEAVHLCTQMRGARELQSSTRTTSWRGNYDTDAQLRAEFFELCGQRG